MQARGATAAVENRLNESPSEKEGKFEQQGERFKTKTASMKALPKRKGN